MKKLLIATHNKGKLSEFSGFLKALPLRIISLSELSITEDVVEDGSTYEENSQKKALFYARRSGIPSIADDGGIEIAALGNAPGVNSKRWLGEEATEEDIIQKMEELSVSLPKNNRQAKYVTVISLAYPDGKIHSIRGEIEGVIQKKSTNARIKGYPYDLFFFVPVVNKYYHDPSWTAAETRKHNHRHKALRKLKQIILRNLRDA